MWNFTRVFIEACKQEKIAHAKWIQIVAARLIRHIRDEGCHPAQRILNTFTVGGSPWRSRTTSVAENDR